MKNKTRKIILLDEEMEKIIGTICNSAFKYSGLQIFSEVKTLINSIKEESLKN